MAKQTKHRKTSPKNTQSHVAIGSGTRQSANIQSQSQLNKVLLFIFAGLFGLVGVYLLLSSRASSIPDGSIFTGSYIIDAGGVKTIPQNYPTSLENSILGLSGAVPTMSYDGKNIAYYDVETRQIKTIDATTALQTREFLPSTKRFIQSISYMQWNQDASKLMVQYQIDAGIMRAFVMNSDGTDIVDVPESWNVAVAGWLPDSSGVVYVKDYDKLCTLTLSSKAENCTKLQGYQGYETTGGTVRARIAPNGSTVAIVYKSSLNNEDLAKLYTTTVGGSSLQEVLTLPKDHDITAIAWSPNSEKIAYADQGQLEGQGTALHVYNTADNSDKALTPGGKGTAITQLDWVVREEDKQISQNSLAPTQPKNISGSSASLLSSLSSSQKIQSESALSAPGSKEVVFMSPGSDKNAPTKLQAVNIETGAVRDFLTLPGAGEKWFLDATSPDGKWFSLHKISPIDTRQNIQENWLVKTDASDLRMASRQVIGNNEAGYRLSWTSDSTSFYYVIPSVASSSAQLCKQDAFGENRQCSEIKDGTSSIANSTKLYYGLSKDGANFVLATHEASSNTSKIFKVDTATGVATQLQVLPGTVISGLEWSQDGTRFGVILNGQSGTGVYTMSPDGANFTQINQSAEPFVWVSAG